MKIETIDNVEELEGILYSDVKDILIDKQHIENMLFATRIIFVNNDELIEFMNKLVQCGYENTAFDYVENIYDKVVVDFSKLKRVNEITTKS